jgi:hypothetical protein
MMVSAREKIASSHLERLAIVYLRQSSPRQVRENFRSTERQYALAEEAVRLGWESERVVVVDGDLGISGRFSDTQAREGYKGAGRPGVSGGGRGDLRAGDRQARAQQRGVAAAA